MESTASLNNVLPYQESGPEDLIVMVDKPEKILSTMDTYVIFRVTTKVLLFPPVVPIHPAC